MRMGVQLISRDLLTQVAQYALGEMRLVEYMVKLRCRREICPWRT